MSDTVLEVEDLQIEIPVAAGLLRPVRGISFNVQKGETLCIVGESGCGKSLTSLAMMGLLPKKARRSATKLSFAEWTSRVLQSGKCQTFAGIDV